MHTVEGMTPRRRQVRVDLGPVALDGDLAVPEDATALVLFAHGSGSSRRSPRNRAVAETLDEAGLATLLMDLLTAGEESVDAQTARLGFDIALLAERVVGAIDWVRRELAPERIGCFGASTGAAVAIMAAAERPGDVGAIVSRGGRPDLAGPALARVRAPTLLIVGAADPVVLDLNRAALAVLRTEKRLDVVPAAGHLFEEPGALERVAALARDWLLRHLAVPARERRAV
jgi:pimeloyl-ACP methyl ester carboxylesterase